jgi:hypothetical protein
VVDKGFELRVDSEASFEEARIEAEYDIEHW